MGAFGERLRREREMRGVSLDEIAATTKIGTRLLRALEDEQFELLPGGIFNKGFIRAYAKYLGIDEESAVADYLTASGHREADLCVVAAQSASDYSSHGGTAATASARRFSFPIIPVFILIVVVAGATGAWRIFQDRHREPSNGSAIQAPIVTMTVPQARTNAPEPTLSGTSDKKNSAMPALSAKDRPDNRSTGAPIKATPPPSENPLAKAKTAEYPPSKETSAASAMRGAPQGSLIAAANPIETSSTPFEIIVKAKEPAWVSIKSDGKIMVRGIIKPRDIKTIHASDQVVFWTGNAGDVQVSFNGRDVPLSGGQNEERLLVFNSRGLLPQAP